MLTECPYKWARKYVGVKPEPEPRRPDDPAEAGSALHEAIETTLKAWVEGGTPVLAPMPLRVRDLFDGWRSRFQFDTTKWYLVEETLRGQVGPYATQSRADLIYAEGLTLKIDDWKSSRAIDDAAELRYEMQPQLNCMNAFLDPRFAAFDEVKFSNIYIRYGNRRRTVSYFRSELPKLIDSFLFWVNRGIECLTERQFDATPGRHCANADGFPVCEYYYECPKRLNAQTIYFYVESEDQIREIADAYYESTKEAKVAKEAIKRWVEGHGDLTHNGTKWAFKATKKTEVDIQKIPESLMKESFQHAKIDATKTGDNTILENPDLLKRLKAAGAVSETESCEFKGGKATKK